MTRSDHVQCLICEHKTFAAGKQGKQRQDSAAYDYDVQLQPYPPQLATKSSAQNSNIARRPELPSERRLKYELNHYIDHSTLLLNSQFRTNLVDGRQRVYSHR